MPKPAVYGFAMAAPKVAMVGASLRPPPMYMYVELADAVPSGFVTPGV